MAAPILDPDDGALFRAQVQMVDAHVKRGRIVHVHARDRLQRPDGIDEPRTTPLGAPARGVRGFHQDRQRLFVVETRSQGFHQGKQTETWGTA